MINSKMITRERFWNIPAKMIKKMISSKRQKVPTKMIKKSNLAH